jgi:hypothetical protein
MIMAQYLDYIGLVYYDTKLKRFVKKLDNGVEERADEKIKTRLRKEDSMTTDEIDAIINEVENNKK